MKKEKSEDLLLEEIKLLKKQINLLESKIREMQEYKESVRENNDIRKDTSKIENIDIKELISKLENNAWNGTVKNIAYIVSGNDIVTLCGYVYEPSYEYFSATHSISINGTVLFAEDSRNIEAYHNESYTYGVFENSEEAIQYLKKYLKDKEVTLQYEKPSIQMQTNKEQEDFKQDEIEEEEEEF